MANLKIQSTLLIVLGLILISINLLIPNNCSANEQKPEEEEAKPLTNWMNLEAATALIKQPGKRVIISEDDSYTNGPVNRPENYDYNNYSISIIGPNKERVKILEKCRAQFDQQPGNGDLLVFALVNSINKQGDIGGHISIKPVIINQSGVEVIEFDKPETTLTWFGATGLLAEIIYDERYSLRNNKRDKINSIRLLTIKGKLVKTIDLKSLLKPYISLNIKISKHQNGLICSSEVEDWLITANEDPKLLSNPFILQKSEDGYIYASEYTDYLQNVIFSSPTVTVYSIVRPFKVILPEYKNIEKTFEIQNQFLMRKSDNKLHTWNFSKFLYDVYYTSDLKSGFCISRFGQYAKVDLETGEYSTVKLENQMNELAIAYYFDSISFDSNTNELILCRYGKVFHIIGEKLELLEQFNKPVKYYVLSGK